MNRLLERPHRFATDGLVAMVRLYQVTISPWLGPACRHEPTCSHYMIAALRKYGIVRGGLRGLWRIVRCNPFGTSGYDPP